MTTQQTKEKVKLKGITALLEDRERLYTENELRLSVKSGIFEALKSNGSILATSKVEAICDQVCNTLNSRK